LNSFCSSFESSKAENGPLNPAAAIVPGLGIGLLSSVAGSSLGLGIGFSSGGWVALWTVEQAIEQLHLISLGEWN